MSRETPVEEPAIDPKNLSAEQKRELLARLLAKKKARGQGAEQGPEAAQEAAAAPPEPQTFPLSFAQQRLWFLDQLDPGNPAYNNYVTVDVKGALDTAVLERAVAHVVERHEGLRTAFAYRGEEPVQSIEEAPRGRRRVRLPVIDLEGLDPTELDSGRRDFGTRRREATRLAVAEAARPFDLERPPLLRAALARHHREHHALMLTVHHIVSDGWSVTLLIREVAQLYAAFAAGQPSPLPPLPIQPVDFAQWQRDRLSGERRSRQLDFWRRRLEGLEPLELPADRPRPPAPTGRGLRVRSLHGGETVQLLEELGGRRDSSLFMTLLSVFAVLLARLGGSTDLALGTPVSHRDRRELEGMLGLLINTLVLRVELDPRLPFDQLLARVRDRCLEAYEHQEVPFELLVDELVQDRDLSRPPLVQVMFQLDQHEHLMEGAEQLPGLKLIPQETDSGTAKLDLSLILERKGDELAVIVEIDQDLFDRTTGLRFLHGYSRLLHAVLERPEAPLGELQLLSAPERHQLLREWNHRPRLPKVDSSGSPDAFAALALRGAVLLGDPSATALVGAGEEWTYSQLACRTRLLARWLRSQGVERGTLVALCLERSPAMVAAALAVLAAGGAYLPLDPAHPAARTALVFEDAMPALLLTDEGSQGNLPQGSWTILHLDQGEPREILSGELDSQDAADDTEALGDATESDLAYVIYTSGSTGRPKGVEVPRSGLAAFLRSMARRPGLGAGDTLMAVTTLAFDIAALELFLPLTVGARTVVATAAEAGDGAGLSELLQRTCATVVQGTPATWRLLLEAGWRREGGLKKALCGGEALPRELAESLLELGLEVWNLYGPTETTVWSAVDAVRSGEPWVAFGGPLHGTTLQVLDGGLRPVPLGAVGELYIGGAGVTRGYRHRPALTAERFLPDPLAAQDGEASGARMYRTGDLVRWLPDGRLRFLARVDHQIKLRGYRIELGEIESALASLSSEQEGAIRRAPIQGVAVALRTTTAGEPALVAYVVSPELQKLEPEEQVRCREEWRQELTRRLPGYMVPSFFVLLDQLPTTASGKLDRRALPQPEAPAADRRREPPATETEERLAEIWGEILGLDELGVEESFFTLGGHSLLAVRMLSRVSSRLEVELPVQAVFDAPTVRRLAARVDALRWARQAPEEDLGDDREEFEL
ncbi:MAG: amino acid adenylation domain-containing protein [Acidobacteriota bacterium]|nr:amino acid adenylation domain-containing protein [Acidobacteriota bacterium]